MKKILIIQAFLMILIISGCGFKVVDQSKASKFHIAEIITSGDKRINFKLRNKLLFSSKEKQNNLLKVELRTNKKRTIKEKNIKNEITKYQIHIYVLVKYGKINDLNSYEFSKTQSGEFNVTKQHSQTLNNEKKLIELLTESLADDILEELHVKINDL